MTQTFPIANIIVGPRIRDAIEASLKPLAESIKTEGLLNPIVLRILPNGKAKLCAGLHRLEVCRRLGWTHIPYTALPLTGDDETDDIAEGMAECDENIIRNDLSDVAMRAPFTYRKAQLLSQRKIIQTRKEAEARQAAARVAAKNAIDPIAKSKAKKEENAAANAAMRARQAIARFDYVEKLPITASYPAVEETVIKGWKPDPSKRDPDSEYKHRLPTGVVSEMVDETGLSYPTLAYDIGLVRAFGLETLGYAAKLEMHLGNFTTKSEMEALRKLKTEFPEDYARVVASWKEKVESDKGMALRPSQYLAEKTRLRNHDARVEALNKVPAALREITKLINAARGSMIDAGGTTLRHPELKTKLYPQIEKLRVSLGELETKVKHMTEMVD